MEPFRRFIDQYEQDQEGALLVSLAQGRVLIPYIAKLLPGCCLQTKFNVYAILKEISVERLKLPFLTFNEWNGEGSSLGLAIIKKIRSGSSDLIIHVHKNSKNKSCRLIPKQIFEAGLNFHYDLHGFIECRGSDGLQEHIAYLKIGGKAWYQCRNERVHSLSSNHLNIPLLSAEILHYKKYFT